MDRKVISHVQGSIMKVLLVGIYDTDTVSLAPHILRSYVEQFDISSKFEIITREYSIFDNSAEAMARDIREERPDVIGFSVYIWNVDAVLEIIRHIDAITILGGPQVTGIEEELIRENPDIDIIVTGEGEVAFKKLLEYLAGEKSVEEISGITTNKTSTEPRMKMVALDSIPPVYERIFTEYPNIRWISFETSRGCPMSCKFCTWGYTKKMRYFSLERVKKDLDIILSQKRIEHIYLCDSSLLLNKKRAKQILQHIINSKTNKSIRYEFTAEQLDDEIIDLLRQLPNHEFNFGIQSINRQALSDMRRTFHRDKFEENYHKVSKKFKEPKITVDLIYGLPGDDIEGYKESLNYVISLDGVGRILTNPLLVLPGSDFYRNMDKYGIRLRDKKSCIVRENYTFSEQGIALAKKYSFFVSVIYLNHRLRDCIKSFAKWHMKKYIETIIDFMESLTFDITKRKYPDMIPSVKEGFEQRNAVFRNVINKYDDIVTLFKAFSDHRYDSLLADYKNHYADHYYKLKRFAG